MAAPKISPAPDDQHQTHFHRLMLTREKFFCLPPALFDNVASESRDLGGNRPADQPANHRANERTFLSWLRLSIVLVIVGIGNASTKLGSLICSHRHQFQFQSGAPKQHRFTRPLPSGHSIQ